MPLQTPNLPLDLTGSSLANKVVGEAHTVNGVVGRTIATNYGSFFTESLIVRNAGTMAILQPGLHYVAIHLNKQGSLASGKEVCGVINFLNNYDGDVLVDYQAIGGQYSGNVDAIRQLIDSIAQDDRPVTWGSILFAPNQFTPAAHLHHLQELYGWEGVITLLDEIRNNILVGDQGAREAMYKWLEYQLGLQQQAIDDAIDAIPALVAGKLDKVQNLADLPNKKTARQNLGVERLLPKAIARFKGRPVAADFVRVYYNFTIPANSTQLVLTRTHHTSIGGVVTNNPLPTGDDRGYPTNPLNLIGHLTVNPLSIRVNHRVRVISVSTRGFDFGNDNRIAGREGAVSQHTVTPITPGDGYTQTMVLANIGVTTSIVDRTGVCYISFQRMLTGHNVANVIRRAEGKYMVNFSLNAFNETIGWELRDRWAVPTMVRLSQTEGSNDGNRGHMMDLERQYAGTTLNANPTPYWAALTCNFTDNDNVVDMMTGGAMFYELLD